MFYRNIELMQKIRHEQLLREAQQYRLIKQAMNGQEKIARPRSPKMVEQVVDWLGDRMIAAGHNLKRQPQPDCSGRPAVN